MVNRRGLVDYHYYVPYRGCLVDYLWYERNLKYKKALMGPLSLIFTRFTVPNPNSRLIIFHSSVHLRLIFRVTMSQTQLIIYQNFNINSFIHFLGVKI